LGGIRSKTSCGKQGKRLNSLASSERLLTLVLPGNPLTVTGGYEYDRRMAEGLRALNWTVQVRCLDNSFPLPSNAALKDAHDQLSALPEGSLVMIDGLALGAMPDVVDAHAKRLRMVGLVHHPLADETGLSSQLATQLEASERRALAAMRLVVVTSQCTRRALAAYQVPLHRIAVAEPGVVHPESDILGSNSRQADALSKSVSMLCVATVTPRKGHDLLVDALTGLTGSRWTLTCVGDLERNPATVRELRSRIASAGLQDRVALLGGVDEAMLDEQFRRADLFVLATRFEGYGMAVARALTYGLPVISTRTGAINELVSADAGLLIEPNDGAALRDALSRVLSDPALRARLSSSARAVGAKLPSWRAASEHLSQILAGVEPSQFLEGPQ
jgi:glycosyltransferase involved in cell wall biosynthesis